MGKDFFSQRLRKIQVQRVHGTQNSNVSQNFTLLIEYGRVLALEGLEQPEIVGQHSLEKSDAVRAGELEQGPVGEIDEPGGFAHSAVFRCSIAEVIRQQPTVAFRENCAAAFVKVKQGRLLRHLQRI